MIIIIHDVWYVHVHDYTTYIPDCVVVCVTAENCVFGVPLTTLLQNDQQRVPNTQIPLILEEVQSVFVISTYVYVCSFSFGFNTR